MENESRGEERFAVRTWNILIGLCNGHTMCRYEMEAIFFRNSPSGDRIDLPRGKKVQRDKKKHAKRALFCREAALFESSENKTPHRQENEAHQHRIKLGIPVHGTPSA